MYNVTYVVKQDHRNGKYTCIIFLYHGSRPKNKIGARKGHSLDVYVKYECSLA